MNKMELSWDDVERLAQKCLPHVVQTLPNCDELVIYGVPRGGILAGLLVKREMEGEGWEVRMTDKLAEANLIVDDVIDTGATRERYARRDPIPFVALIDKTRREQDKDVWVVFPWEVDELAGPEQNVRRLLEYIGEDPNREGLKQTPERVLAAYDELFSGYEMDPAKHITLFRHDNYDELVLLKDIEFYSTCEHHIMPFFGRAHVAYVPGKTLLGISKLARIVDIYARRLQIQERLCKEVTKAIDDLIKPKGSACVLEAQHFCMTSRGVGKQNSVMVTSSLTGCFLEEAKTRHEFMTLIGERR